MSDKKRVDIITEKTGLPLGMVIVIVGGVISATLWMSSLEAKVSKLTEDKKTLAVILRSINTMKEDIGYIKGKLESLGDK